MGAGRLQSMMLLSACGVACALGALAGALPQAAYAVNPFGETGQEAGQLNDPLGIGLDQQSGDLYVPEFYNERVSKFDGSGSFLFAWGWRVNAEHPANEPQTCTSSTGCIQGIAGEGPGEFASSCGAQAVAVDNDPLSSSYEDVYVADFCNYRVQKFDPSGKFLLMFGGHVNEAQDANPSATEAQKDVCVSGEACTAGTPGGANGEFAWAYQGVNIAVGPSGDVYVGDQARVEVFEPSGVWKEEVSLKGLTGEGKVTALAVDSKGDMFVKVEGVPGVRELEPGGVEAPVKFDASSETVEAVTVDESSGNLFVADAAGSLHIVQYGPAGTELESFGSKTAASTRGIAYSEALHELYVVDRSQGDIWRLTVPATGPVVEPGSEMATPELHGAARLLATIDPEGNDTSYHFEYVTDEQFKANGFTGATSTPATPVGTSSEDFEEHPVEAVFPAKTLVPGVTYHWRVVASDTSGHTTPGPGESFQETPAARVEGPWSANVASSSVTLAAQIDPLDSNTSYRLEVTGPSYEHVFAGNVGEGMGYVPISFHIQNLQASAAYHYKLVTSSETGTTESSIRSFTTQLAGIELTLPDSRAWELVSPPNKKGAVIEPILLNIIQSASDGSGIAYPTAGPHVGDNPAGKSIFSYVLSKHRDGGWESSDISLPRRPIAEGEPKFALVYGVFGAHYDVFSPDLSLAAVEPTANSTPLLSPEASERTVYVRDNEKGAFVPLVTASNVPSGTKFGAEETASFGGAEHFEMRFGDAVPDLSHVIVGSPFALTKEADSVLSPRVLENLYEWSKGRLQLVNMLPNEEPTHESFSAEMAGEKVAAGLGARDMSTDGRWVAWTWGDPYAGGGRYEFKSYNGLYVRDMIARRTFKVGGSHALYQTMNSDGSKVLFIEDGELHEFSTTTQTDMNLTADHLHGESSAGVNEDVSDVSEDGSYLYFVASGVLADGAVSGGDNLYLLHESGGSWSTSYIATLSAEDAKSWHSNHDESEGGIDLAEVSSRVSPDGRYLAFMSSRSLTGYDNTDASSGQPDEEVFLYDSLTTHLACVSCNPTGARPVGVFDYRASMLIDRNQFWTEHWLSGSVPGWDYRGGSGALYQPRYLSNGGRLFFDSADALVPQDTNGLEDVYEYEPAGAGSCVASDETFSALSGGCVNLISSGIASAESMFYDASATGSDVFFITQGRLVSEDYDTSYDVYDAHVCSSSAPCATAPVSPPPCTSGDSCKAAPSPQPEIFGSAPSATFSGQGNVIEPAKKLVAKRAHRVRHKRRAKHKRRRNARAMHSHSAKTSVKGGK